MTAVELFSKQGCPKCGTARRLLTRLGLAFHEFDTAHDPCAEELKHRMNGRAERRARQKAQRRDRRQPRLPQLFIDGRPIGDHEALLRMAEDGRLDEALGNRKNAAE